MTVAKLRPVIDADEDFLFRLFCSARETEFAALQVPPAEKSQLLRMQFVAQQKYYHSQYPDADFDIVLRDELPAGNLYALRSPRRFILIDITLLPQFRNRGIGGWLVHNLINEAREAGVTLRAHVAKQNLAWRLWKRLGFRQIDDDGVYLKIEV